MHHANNSATCSPPHSQDALTYRELVVRWRNSFLRPNRPHTTPIPISPAPMNCLEVPKRHPPKGHPQNLLEYYLNFLSSLELHWHILNFHIALEVSYPPGPLWEGALKVLPNCPSIPQEFVGTAGGCPRKPNRIPGNSLEFA